MSDSMINWELVNKADTKIIFAIVKRASEMLDSLEDINHIDRISLDMDITACHILNPLNLQQLLDSDDSNFAHDVFGIHRHIDRNTGELLNCFSPRFTA